MSDQDNTNTTNEPEATASTPAAPAGRRVQSKLIGGAALVGMLLVGAVAGAGVMKLSNHDERQALLPPVAISAMADDALVAVKGNVAEIFGNKFIISDSSGRALVDVGPEGDDAPVVKQNEEITVQGRFDNGFIRAGMVIHADGRVDELRPPHRHGPRDGGPRHGWKDVGPGRHGPAVEGENIPPPPPGA